VKTPRELAHEFCATTFGMDRCYAVAVHCRQCDILTAMIEARDAEVREAMWAKLRAAVANMNGGTK